VTAGTLIALVGAVVLRLTLSGAYLRYVQDGMRPWLLMAGAALIALGAVTVVRAFRALRTTPAGHDDDHDQPREGWLLLAPIAVLLLVAPPALGSFGVDRAAPVDVRAGASEFDPLPPSAGPVRMSLLEYGQRAFDGDGRTLGDATVELTGFVARGGSASSFRLARYQIACCAADAAAMIVRVVGVAGRPPSADQWVVVTGHFHPARGETPELTASTVQQIPPPEDPYE
jgi:uncharacterized repeat protein (TIGR03943 family)